MRLKQDDKTLARNLALLFNCSKIEEIYLHSLESEVNSYAQYLDSKQGKPFKIILERLMREHFARNGEIAPELQSNKELLSFLPEERFVPVGFRKDFERYKQIFAYTNTLSNKEQQLSEHHELQYLARHSRTGTKELLKFMSSDERTLEFKNFCEYMKTHPASIINYKYSKLATHIAEKNNLYTPEFQNQLSSLLHKPYLGLCHDRTNRFFTSAKKLVPALGLSALVLLGSHLHRDNPLQDPQIDPLATAPTSSTTTTPSNSGNTIDIPSPDPEPQFKPPISSTGTLNTYGDAYEDFSNKLEEAYKYNTGENINLSGLSYKNFGQATTTIYVANYNGKTYRFSEFSPYQNNGTFLEKALLDAGATFTTESSTITYISPDEKQSIAITDSDGNAIRSGNVLEPASYGYQMYNQSYIKDAKKMLEKQGIDTSNMSESELIGKYILSPEYNIQNEELSKILGQCTEVVRNIKNLFKRLSIR